MTVNKTRALFIDTAERMFQTQGFHGVGLAELIRESGAPRGSFYYYFPNGKSELALATIEKSDAEVKQLLTYANCKASTVGEYINILESGLRRWLVKSDYTAGCPIAALTLELGANSPLIAAACKSAYEGWIEMISASITQLDHSQLNATDSATSIVSSLEGSVILGRALRSTDPLVQTARMLIRALS